MQPKVSIIIPVYNIASYLPTCLDTVLNQTYSNLEIIVVNDGSEDNSPEIIKHYATRDSRLVYISQPNGGLPAARRAGTEVASGDFIFHLDGDDYLPDHAIETLITVQQKTDADMVFSNFTEAYSDHTKPVYIPLKNSDTSELSGTDYLRTVVLSPHCRMGYVWGRLFRKELLKNILYQHTNLEEDVYMIFQIATRCKKIAFTPQSTYYYRRHGKSLTNENAIHFQKAHIVHCLAMCSLLPTLPLPRDIFEQFLIYNLRSIAYYFCICKIDTRTSEWRHLKQLYDETLRLNPAVFRQNLFSTNLPYFAYVAIVLRVPYLTRLAYSVSAFRRKQVNY